MKSIVTRPLRAIAATIGTSLAWSASLILAPSASADMRLAYQVIVDDGVGQIVSMGETAEGEAAITDTLGANVRFELVTVSCDESPLPGCEAGEVQVTVSETRDGQVFREFVHGVAVSDTDTTRYEAPISGGRTLVVNVTPRS